jgi:hypothetical protein
MDELMKNIRLYIWPREKMNEMNAISGWRCRYLVKTTRVLGAQQKHPVRIATYKSANHDPKQIPLFHLKLRVRANHCKILKPPSLQALIPKTANRPTLSSHPNTKCILINTILCSSHLISPLVISMTSLTVRPSSCSQARSLQSNFPGVMLPVSSRSVPITRGLR